MKAKKDYKRRKFFIREGSQLRIIFGIQLIFFIMMVICGGIFYKIANKDLTESYFSAHWKIKKTMDLLLPSLLIINFAGLIVGTIVNIFFVHRITGPIHRLCRILKDVGNGNLSHTIKFRDYDELKELAFASNEMMALLKERIHKLKTISVSVEKDIKETNGMENKLPSDLKLTVDKLVKDSQDFVKEMSGYKV